MAYQTIISAGELEQHLGQPGWTVIDCRHSLADPGWGRQAYLQGHIPGAFFAHLDEDLSGEIIPGKTGRHPLPEDWDAFAMQLGSWGVGSSTQVVVYDLSHGGIASRLWWMLKYLGHEQVAVLEGGMENWTREDRPVTDEIPQPQEAHFSPRPHPEMAGDMDFVRSTLQDSHFQVVDSRAADRFAGKEEPIDPVAGHIPGAVNLPFLDNVDADHRWKGRSFLRDRFTPLFTGHEAEQIIVHCGSGVTACHNLLAMTHAGYPMPKLYPGSWSDWITDPKNPVVGS